MKDSIMYENCYGSKERGKKERGGEGGKGGNKLIQKLAKQQQHLC